MRPDIIYRVRGIRGKSKIFISRYKWQRAIKIFVAFQRQAIQKFNLLHSKHNRTMNGYTVGRVTKCGARTIRNAYGLRSASWVSRKQSTNCVSLLLEFGISILMHLYIHQSHGRRPTDGRLIQKKIVD